MSDTPKDLRCPPLSPARAIIGRRPPCHTIQLPSVLELAAMSEEDAARIFHDVVFEVLEQYERLVDHAGLGRGSHARAALAEHVRLDLLERFRLKKGQR